MAADPIKAQINEQLAIDAVIRPLQSTNENRDLRIKALEDVTADHESRITAIEEDL